MLKHFYKIDPEYGERIAKAIGVPVDLAKLWAQDYSSTLDINFKY